MSGAQDTFHTIASYPRVDKFFLWSEATLLRAELALIMFDEIRELEELVLLWLSGSILQGSTRREDQEMCQSVICDVFAEPSRPDAKFVGRARFSLLRAT
jgi:hypothetical protein